VAAKTGTSAEEQHRPRRTLTEVQTNLNNGADPQTEIEAATLPTSKEPVTSSEETPALERIQTPKAFVYDDWYRETPEEARETFARNVLGNWENKIAETYSPQVVAFLRKSAQDPKLLRKLQRIVGDEAAEDFFFNTAYNIYDPQTPAADGQPQPASRELQQVQDDLAALRAEREAERQAEKVRNYQNMRMTELDALVAEFPELRYDKNDPKSEAFQRVAEIHDTTQARSIQENKVIPYRETYERMRKFYGKPVDDTARNYVVPHTTTATDVSAVRSPQAPLTPREVRRNMVAPIKQAGGSLSDFSRSLQRVKVR
jgi:hypothetical protein